MVGFDLIWGIEDSLMVARPLAGNNKGLECVVCLSVYECGLVRLLDLPSHSPLLPERAKIWPFYGQNMVPTWSFKLVLPES